MALGPNVISTKKVPANTSKLLVDGLKRQASCAASKVQNFAASGEDADESPANRLPLECTEIIPVGDAIDVESPNFVRVAGVVADTDGDRLHASGNLIESLRGVVEAVGERVVDTPDFIGLIGVTTSGADLVDGAGHEVKVVGDGVIAKGLVAIDSPDAGTTGGEKRDGRVGDRLKVLR